jgi:hypothetical protein
MHLQGERPILKVSFNDPNEAKETQAWIDERFNGQESKAAKYAIRRARQHDAEFDAIPNTVATTAWYSGALEEVDNETRMTLQAAFEEIANGRSASGASYLNEAAERIRDNE